MTYTGRVALVTGASRGIGAAIAHAFARAGASVALAARDADALAEVAVAIEAEGGTALAVPTDVTDEQAVAALVRTVVERFGALHVAVNNAGGSSGRPTPVADLPTETFVGTVGSNLIATFHCLKYELPAIEAAGGGAIVNMSSTAGLSGAAPGLAAYVAAKHGVQGLSKSAALDYAARGVRVNVIAPGPIMSHRLASLPEEYLEQAAASVPMKRIGEPAEIAAAALWLCSDEASFVTGATLPVDGGRLIAAG